MAARHVAFRTTPLGGGATLHLLRTRAFKTVLVQVLIREDLTARASRTALLPMVLRRGTERFTDMQAMSRFLDDLYGASFHADVMKIGEHLLPFFRMEFLAPAHADRSHDVAADAVEFLAEVVMRPRVVGPAFDPAFVGQEQANLIAHIRSLETDHDHYAAQCLFERMCADERFAYYEYGTVEDAARCTAADLYGYYRKLMTGHPFDIYVVGDVDPAAMEEVLGRAFGRERFAPHALVPTEVRPAVEEVRFFEETRPVEQAKVAAGFRTGVAYDDPLLPALLFFNGIYGGFAFSKLFKTVREKEGLAYYVGSQLERTKGIMLVSTGIEDGNYERVLELIRGLHADMARGALTEDEMESARESLLSRFRSTSDTMHARVNLHLEGLLNNRPVDVDAVLAAVSQVTKEDVGDVARRVKLDTVFRLRPRGAPARSGAEEAP